VVYKNEYKDDSGIQFLLKAGIEVEHIKEIDS
jgi:dCMP deaminase